MVTNVGALMSCQCFHWWSNITTTALQEVNHAGRVICVLFGSGMASVVFNFILLVKSTEAEPNNAETMLAQV